MSIPPVAIPDTEVHPIRSQGVGDDFEIWIARPQAGFAPVQPGPLRVLYVLDANLFFTPTFGLSAWIVARVWF